MKKLVCLVLAVLSVLSVCAFAETTELEYKEVTISMMVSNDQSMAGINAVLGPLRAAALLRSGLLPATWTICDVTK